ncbi:MAG: hypothetical protein R3250_05005, partial [Melioribacteraceae bacterium]|nr:hypothetical protein [Melioribacteraceae bacterium]
MNSSIISLISGFYWLSIGSERNLKFNIVFYSTLLALPLIILLLSTIYCQGCPIDQGFYFYLLFSFPSIFVGIAISSFSHFIYERFRYILFILIWLTMLLGFIPELYYNPQIYFFNAIFVYYPGVIYDQNIELTLKLVYYRSLVLIISLVIIYVFNRKYNFKGITKLIVIIAFISAYLHSYNLKVNLGFSTDLEKISDNLKTVLSSENFDIFLPDSVSDNTIQVALHEHEYYFNSIGSLIGSRPKEKITSLIFETGARKKQLFGSGNADVAKPWLNQIYLNLNNYRSNLKHEIAHIFSADFGKGPLKVPPNINPGIIEGFAMAIENNFDNYDINHLAALAKQNNYKVDLKSLFTDMSFFSSASSLS